MFKFFSFYFNVHIIFCILYRTMYTLFQLLFLYLRIYKLRKNNTSISCLTIRNFFNLISSFFFSFFIQQNIFKGYQCNFSHYGAFVGYVLSKMNSKLTFFYNDREKYYFLYFDSKRRYYQSIARLFFNLITTSAFRVNSVVFYF